LKNGAVQENNSMLHQFPSLPNPPDVPIPATARPLNSRYEMLMRAVQNANGQWVAIIDPTLVAGRDGKQKSTALHAAARTRKMRVQVTNQHGYLYCRLAGRGAKAVA
jgi:hypothetical protein